MTVAQMIVPYDEISNSDNKSFWVSALTQALKLDFTFVIRHKISAHPAVIVKELPAEIAEALPEAKNKTCSGLDKQVHHFEINTSTENVDSFLKWQYIRGLHQEISCKTMTTSSSSCCGWWPNPARMSLNLQLDFLDTLEAVSPLKEKTGETKEQPCDEKVLDRISNLDKKKLQAFLKTDLSNSLAKIFPNIRQIISEILQPADESKKEGIRMSLLSSSST